MNALFSNMDPTVSIVLFVLALVICMAISVPSGAKNAEKSREEWRALPANKRTEHDGVGNAPSGSAVALGIVVVLAVAYIMVMGGK